MPPAILLPLPPSRPHFAGLLIAVGFARRRKCGGIQKAEGGKTSVPNKSRRDVDVLGRHVSRAVRGEERRHLRRILGIDQGFEGGGAREIRPDLGLAPAS